MAHTFIVIINKILLPSLFSQEQKMHLVTERSTYPKPRSFIILIVKVNVIIKITNVKESREAPYEIGFAKIELKCKNLQMKIFS